MRELAKAMFLVWPQHVAALHRGEEVNSCCACCIFRLSSVSRSCGGCLAAKHRASAGERQSFPNFDCSHLGRVEGIHMPKYNIYIYIWRNYTHVSNISLCRMPISGYLRVAMYTCLLRLRLALFDLPCVQSGSAFLAESWHLGTGGPITRSEDQSPERS